MFDNTYGYVVRFMVARQCRCNNFAICCSLCTLLIREVPRPLRIRDREDKGEEEEEEELEKHVSKTNLAQVNWHEATRRVSDRVALIGEH